MDDGWQLNLEQLQLSHMQLLKTLTMYHFDNDASNYIKNVFEYYNNSLNVYG